MTIRKDFATASIVLAAAVANGATFTVGYPVGTSQLSFLAGLAGTAHYAILNSNDKWVVGSPGIAVSFDASLITITNNSGYSWPAGTNVYLQFAKNAGNARIPFAIPLPPLANLANGDIVTDVRPGIVGVIEHWEFVTTVPATTAAKLATLNLEIDATNVTGGTLALTSALVTPMGKAIAGAAITGANVLTRDSKLSVEASAVTAFVEGAGFLIVYIRPTENVQGF